jgi:hypothetical protein
MLKMLSDTNIIMNILYNIETGLMSLLIVLEELWHKTLIRKDSANEKKEHFYTSSLLKYLELHPICLPVGLPVSVSYQPSSVGIFGIGIWY